MQPINWLERKFKVTCDVNFTRGTPVTVPGYRPHIVMEDDPEYKGVTFLSPLAIGENKVVRFEPLYETIDYAPVMRIGHKFEIKEGRNTVGTGVITFVKDKFCSQ